MKLRRLATAVLLCAPAIAASEELQHELLVFGSAEITRTSDVEVPSADVSDEIIAGDVLFSLQRGRLRLFGEYLLSNREAELERFQIGWEPSEDLIVWLGRFHQPSSVWNHEYHHGQFLQTSITRPAIEEFEDTGGVIPQHFFGLLTESSWRLARGGALHTAFGGGIAPVLTPDGLAPFDVLSPHTREHQLGFQARAAFLPRELEDTGVGLLIGHNEINWLGEPPPQFADISHVDQMVIGAYASYARESWKVYGTLYHVSATLKDAVDRSSDETFAVGYVQAERQLPRHLELFARHEDSRDVNDSGYLRLFRNFVVSRTSVGLRWEFTRRHALTLQFSDSHTLVDDYREFRLQWSAALL